MPILLCALMTKSCQVIKFGLETFFTEPIMKIPTVLIDGGRVGAVCGSVLVIVVTADAEKWWILP